MRSLGPILRHWRLCAVLLACPAALADEAPANVMPIRDRTHPVKASLIPPAHAKGPQNVTLVQLHGRFRMGGTFAFGNGFAYYGGPWNYPLFSPYPAFYGYPYVFPPIVLPAGSLYGPEAVANFVAGSGNLGMGPAQGVPLPNVRINPPATKDGPAPMELEPGVRPPRRQSNDEVRARAMRQVLTGDERFRVQKYDEAYQRYRRASESAPDLGEGLLRQGLALVALSRYEMAAKKLKRGIELNPRSPQLSFRLDDLYGDNKLAKTSHFEALALTAAADPGNADLLFIIGLLLYFDGQAERSRTFFEKAETLDDHLTRHARGFLRELGHKRVAKCAGLDL